MKVDFAMWRKALNVIPEVSQEEWGDLDVVSRWLISSRAAVLIMTFLSAALAGIFALRAGSFQFVPWLALALGLVFAHAANNIFNDFTDFVRGVDKDNYFRTVYGAQPVASGLVTPQEHLTYFFITGLCAIIPALYLLLINRWDSGILILIALGAFFVLFYTWPLKYLALGEVAVLLVWGPLMIGGGFYVLAHYWDWNVVIASLPYVLGVTTVIFGKHIDKLVIDKQKRIFTVPVLIGERLARYGVLAMMILPYLATMYLIATHFFTPVLAVIMLAVPTLWRTVPPFLRPKPVTRPADFPDGQGGWPLYFAPLAFVNNRAFGGWFLIGVILDAVLRMVPLTSGFWR
ncbi:MAG TPA: prenyltransferase [Anaerolineales bacterium]|nr:prenyltransferase [Anaerolineales bacterium]